MVRLPILKPRDVERTLKAMGFELVRQRGSHRQYRHADGRATTIPFHGSRDIAPPLLRQIIKDIECTPEEFLRHR